ncbi:TolC family protein [Pedobacter sp.]|uniref:TolC family protein n=1 Tax=Pedobacter sp. TaxID=1411316 RepID=UPI003C35A04F
MKNYLLLPCYLILAGSSAVYAQDSPYITLQQAFEQSEQRYPGITQREAVLSEFQLRKVETRARALPQLQMQMQNTYGSFEGNNGAFIPVPGVFNVTGNTADANGHVNAVSNTFASAVMDWKVFEFGRQRKAVEAAEYQVRGAAEGLEGSKLALKAKVAGLYFNILYAEAALDWSEKNLLRMGQILESSKSLAEAGLKPGADTSLVASSHAQARAYRSEWLGRYRASLESFREVMDVPAGKLPLEIFYRYKMQAKTYDSVRLSHPYLQVLENEVGYQTAQQSLAGKNALPSLSILGGLSARGSGINGRGGFDGSIGAGYGNYANNYLVGIGLTWNLTNIYSSGISRKRIGESVRSTQARYDLQRLQMQTTLRAQYESIAAQYQKLAQQETAVAKAESAYALYLSRYEGGLINLTELLQIQLLLQGAEKERIESTQKMWALLTSQAELAGDFNFLTTLTR